MQDWLTSHPDIRSIRVAAVDVNGQALGKRIPVALAAKALSGETRMPVSALNADILGHDIKDSPLVFESGDRDGLLRPTERGFVEMPWLQAPAALLPVSMYLEDGTPFTGDPRHVLASTVARYAEHGWEPQVATELEFYLVDDSGPSLRPPVPPGTGRRLRAPEMLSIGSLDAFDAFFDELYAACDLMGIPAETATSESGMGQYEINLTHGTPLKVADDTWLFKMLVKGLARRHGYAATFLAKPYPDHAGSGMHVHFSVRDKAGINAFDDGTEKGAQLLRAAVAGCLDAIADSMLVFAPHASSYARLVPGAHAPTGISWAYENRTAALRVPSGPGPARRIEHRVAGGDINPYLLIAAILGAALVGIEDKLDPAPPITGNAYDMDLPQVPTSWDDAIGRFERSGLLKRIFPREFLRNYAMTKRQEERAFADIPLAEQEATYLERV